MSTTPLPGHRGAVSAPLPLTAMATALLLAGLVAGATAMARGSQPPEITLLASPALRGVVSDLAATFERDTGARILARYEVFDVVKRRIDGGEPFDIAILSPDLIDTLIAQRIVARDTRLDVGRHGVAVGAIHGAPMPDISTPAALSAMLRSATSIAHFKEGTAGAHFLSVVDRLGLSNDVARVLQAYDAAGVDEAVRSGRTQYVVGGMGTLRGIPGIGDARNLPDTLQQYTTYTAGVSTSSRQADTARAFLRRLAAPEARAVITKHGLEPVVGSRPIEQPNAPRWVTAWSTSQQVLGDAPISNASVRVIARPTMSGDRVRVRFDNTFGMTPVTFDEVTIGHRTRGAALAEGSLRDVTFDGRPSVTIPPGGSATSDPVALAVIAMLDVAVSRSVPGARVRPSQHSNAYVTSYRSADGSGNAVHDAGGGAYGATTTATWWLKGLDVQTTEAVGAVVALGDSITDGTCSTIDAHDRWVDLLATRLDLERGETSRRGALAVLNEGIGGNTITRAGLNPPPDSAPGLERLERDVLSHQGVASAILFPGTNDIRRGAAADAVIAGLTAATQRLRDRGLRVFGATMLPRHNAPPSGTNSGWNDQTDGTRASVNAWIRTYKEFAGVIDFEQALQATGLPRRMRPAFNCDGVHPTPRGYYEMGKAIDLQLFRPEIRAPLN